MKESSMIVIENYKEINKGALIAKFNAIIPKWGDFIIHEMCYFKKDSKRWVTYPQREYEKDGQKKYFQYNGFKDMKMNDTFKNKILESIDEYLKKNPSSQQQPELFNNEPEPPPF